MATTISRARMLCSYARRGVTDAVELDNCKTLVLRIKWEDLRDEDSDLYEKAYNAAKSVGLSDILARVCVSYKG